MLTIEDRLAAVEKTNRKLKLCTVLMLILILMVGCRGAMRGNFDEITARKITVHGQFGEAIVVIGSADTLEVGDAMSVSNGGAVVVQDGLGDHTAGLIANMKSAGVALSSINPDKMVILSSENDKGFTGLKITAPDAEAHLSVAGKTPHLQIVSGKARVTAGIASGVPLVAVDNGSDLETLTIGQQP